MSSLSTEKTISQLLAEDTSKNWPKQIVLFSRLFDSIKKKLNLAEEPSVTPANEAIAEQQKQAQKYLDNGYYGSYLTMLRAQYQPTDKQRNQFKDNFDKIFDRTSPIKGNQLLETHLQEGGKLDMDIMFHLLIAGHEDNYHFYFKEVIKGEENTLLSGPYPLLDKAYKDFIAQPDFSEKIMTRWLEEVQSINVNTQYPYHKFVSLQKGLNAKLQLQPDLFLKNVSLSDTMDIISKANVVLGQMNDCLKNKDYHEYNRNRDYREESQTMISVKFPQIIEKHYKQDIIQKMQKTRDIYEPGASQELDAKLNIVNTFR